MKFALVNGERVEATKGARGLCPCCGEQLIAKCGETRVNHWARKGGQNCDPWWENETHWHRSWKDKFPREWQEVIHFNETREKHIADVKTDSGYVLEFQHSYLDPEERRSRNAFYGRLVWVVNGTRRKTDKPQFQKILEEGATVLRSPPILRVHFPDEYRLLKEWHDSNVLVFFDFQEENDPNQSMLWFLFPKIDTTEAYISPFSRQQFIEMQNDNKFDEFVKNIIFPISKELAQGIQIRRKNTEVGHLNRASAFDLYLANKRRRQRRF